MAIRITSQGVQSYDPGQFPATVKKEKSDPTITKASGGISEPPVSNVSDGNQIIRDIEKNKVKLLNQGYTQKQADSIARQIVSAAEEAKLTMGSSSPVSVAGAKQQQETQAKQLETAGAFEEVKTQEVPLFPETTGALSDVPILSSSIGALSATKPISPILNAILGEDLIKDFSQTAEEAFPMTDETIREKALIEIKRKSYKKGISNAEKFGTFVESVPIVGSLARKWAAGLIETPSSNADEVIGEIRSERERAATSAEKVRNGLMDPNYGLENARMMEENISELEGRLKLLINTSPILRANRDEVNKIQEEILRSRERVNQFRQASSFALTAQITGTGRVIPTDEQIYFELKELNK